MPSPPDSEGTPVGTPPKLKLITHLPPSPPEFHPAPPTPFPPADWPTWSAIESSASSATKNFLETTAPTPRADSPKNHTSSSENDNNNENNNNNSPPSPRKRSQSNAQLLLQQKEKEQEQEREEEHARILGEDGGGGKFGVNEVFAAVRAGVDSERLVGRMMTWRAENEKERIAKGSGDGKEGKREKGKGEK